MRCSQILGLGYRKSCKPCVSGLKKTRPFRFLLLKSVVLNCFMVSSCIFWWSFTWQTLAVDARNRAKTTIFTSAVLETPVILMPECCLFPRSNREIAHQPAGLANHRFLPLKGSQMVNFSVCALFCYQNLCCASRVYSGDRGGCGQLIQTNYSSEAQSEAPTRSREPHQQHPGPENQDGQHVLNQPRGSCPDSLSLSIYLFVFLFLPLCFCHVALFVYLSLSLFTCLCLSLSLFISISLSLRVPLSVCYIYIYIYLSLSISFHL